MLVEGVEQATDAARPAKLLVGMTRAQARPHLYETPEA